MIEDDRRWSWRRATRDYTLSLTRFYSRYYYTALLFLSLIFSHIFFFFLYSFFWYAARPVENIYRVSCQLERWINEGTIVTKLDKKKPHDSSSLSLYLSFTFTLSLSLFLLPSHTFHPCLLFSLSLPNYLLFSEIAWILIEKDEEKKNIPSFVSFLIPNPVCLAERSSL